MEKYIEKIKSFPLSGRELLEAIDPIPAKIERSTNFKNYDDIDELFEGYDVVIILYETNPNYGHWCCLIRHEDGVIEFFDPYGYKIDEQLKFIEKNFQRETDQYEPVLKKLLYNSPYPISYNNKKLQKDYKDNNSCGRHIITRIILKELGIKDYQKLLGSSRRKLDADDKVSYLTAFI